MKTKTTTFFNLLKSNFLKVLVVTAFFAVAFTAKSNAQDVYARVEIENYNTQNLPDATQYTGDIYIRYYSDYDCTSPTTCPITGDVTLINSSADIGTGPNNPVLTPYSVSVVASTSETLVATNVGLGVELYEDATRSVLTYWVEVRHNFEAGNYNGVLIGSAPYIFVP